jgi:crotonobetainyl-CoA:carnitine CoA-transferase CaiB-like acyl-CoA transferase
MQAVARKLTTTRTPEGRTVRLPPPAVDLTTTPSEYAFAPRYGEHTESVLREASFSEREIAELRGHRSLADFSRKQDLVSMPLCWVLAA